jgi:hypothetical protein
LGGGDFIPFIRGEEVFILTVEVVNVRFLSTIPWGGGGDDLKGGGRGFGDVQVPDAALIIISSNRQQHRPAAFSPIKKNGP